MKTYYNPMNFTFQAREKMLASRVAKLETLVNSKKFTGGQLIRVRSFLFNARADLRNIRASMNILDIA